MRNRYEAKVMAAIAAAVLCGCALAHAGDAPDRWQTTTMEELQRGTKLAAFPKADQRLALSAALCEAQRAQKAAGGRRAALEAMAGRTGIDPQRSRATAGAVQQRSALEVAAARKRLRAIGGAQGCEAKPVRALLRCVRSEEECAAQDAYEAARSEIEDEALQGMEGGGE
jgi:hypothetical protein